MVASQKRKGEDFEIPEAKRKSKEIFSAQEAPKKSNLEKDMSAGEAKIGKAAPAFKTNALVNGEFKEVSLSDYKGKYVVLFFYPLDFTFVCPTEIIPSPKPPLPLRRVTAPSSLLPPILSSPTLRGPNEAANREASAR